MAPGSTAINSFFCKCNHKIFNMSWSRQGTEMLNWPIDNRRLKIEECVGTGYRLRSLDPSCWLKLFGLPWLSWSRFIQRSGSKQASAERKKKKKKPPDTERLRVEKSAVVNSTHLFARQQLQHTDAIQLLIPSINKWSTSSSLDHVSLFIPIPRRLKDNRLPSLNLACSSSREFPWSLPLVPNANPLTGRTVSYNAAESAEDLRGLSVGSGKLVHPRLIAYCPGRKYDPTAPFLTHCDPGVFSLLSWLWSIFLTQLGQIGVWEVNTILDMAPLSQWKRAKLHVIGKCQEIFQTMAQVFLSGTEPWDRWQWFRWPFDGFWHLEWTRKGIDTGLCINWSCPHCKEPQRKDTRPVMGYFANRLALCMGRRRQTAKWHHKDGHRKTLEASCERRYIFMNYINRLESLLRREQSYRLAFVLTNLRISNLLCRLHASILPRTLSCEMIVDSLVLFVLPEHRIYFPSFTLGVCLRVKRRGLRWV